MKNLILTTAIIALFSTGYTQENKQEDVEESNNKTHFLGVHAGGTTGMGFSYRWFPKKFGFQVTGIPIFNGNNNFFASSAVSFMYKINEHKKIDLFVYQGNHITFQKNSYGYDPYTGQNTTEKITSLNFGLGAGINIHLFDNLIDFTLQTGYGVFNINNSPRSMLTGEIGLYYCF